MSMLRLNVPSVFIYGGSILPGRYKGKDVTVVDVFEAVGKHSSGKMSAHALRKLELKACPSSELVVDNLQQILWHVFQKQLDLHYLILLEHQLLMNKEISTQC